MPPYSLRGDEIGVLDDPGEWQVGVGDVEPVDSDSGCVNWSRTTIAASYSSPCNFASYSSGRSGTRRDRTGEGVVTTTASTGIFAICRARRPRPSSSRSQCRWSVASDDFGAGGASGVASASIEDVEAAPEVAEMLSRRAASGGRSCAARSCPRTRPSRPDRGTARTWLAVERRMSGRRRACRAPGAAMTRR